MKGFTLIEVLVVIAIIAVLAAILFPVLSQAREDSHKAVCVSNLHQIATAEQEYLSDNGGKYYAKSTAQFAPAYYFALRPYAKDIGKLGCPDDPLVGSPVHRWDPLDSMVYTGYAMNGCLPNEGAVISPAKMILFAEIAPIKQLHPPDTVFSAPQSYLTSPDISNWDNVNYTVDGQFGAVRHFGKGNYAMADGHVELVGPNNVRYFWDRGCTATDKSHLYGNSNSISFPNLN